MNISYDFLRCPKEIDDFVQSVIGNRNPLVGLDKALEIQILLDALYRSMETGLYVELDSE